MTEFFIAFSVVIAIACGFTTLALALTLLEAPRYQQRITCVAIAGFILLTASAAGTAAALA